MGQQLGSLAELQLTAERSETSGGFPKHRPAEYPVINEDRRGEFSRGRNTIRAAMKNRKSLIGWKRLLTSSGRSGPNSAIA